MVFEYGLYLGFSGLKARRLVNLKIKKSYTGHQLFLRHKMAYGKSSGKGGAGGKGGKGGKGGAGKSKKAPQSRSVRSGLQVSPRLHR